MISMPAIVLYGPTITACCFAASSLRMPGMRRGSSRMLTSTPSCTSVATASGTASTVRFSHSSRRTDQSIGRVSRVDGGAAA